MSRRKNFQSPRSKGRLLNWVTLFVSFCVAGVAAFTLGEIYVRVFSPFGYVTPDVLREKSLEYDATVFATHAFPQMEQSYQINDTTGFVRINKLGYKGPEFRIPKPIGTIRIVFLGGSAVFDQYAREGRDWPHLVEKKLYDSGHENVEIINAGTPGHQTLDSLGRLYSEIWMFEPDIVVVYQAWNDIKYFGKLNPQHSLLRTYRPYSSHQVAGRNLVWNPNLYYTGPIDRLLCHSQLYVRIRSRYLSWRMGSIGPEGLITGKTESRARYRESYSEWGPRQYKLNLHLIAKASKAIGAVPALLIQARLPIIESSPADLERIQYDYVNLSHHALVEAFADCDKAIFEVSKVENIPMLDLSLEFSGRSDYFSDHIHTTPQGSEAIAQAVSKFLAELISERYQ